MAYTFSPAAKLAPITNETICAWFNGIGVYYSMARSVQE
jgi:hypothetical protein